MEISECDTQEFGEFPNSDSAENVNYSLVDNSVSKVVQVDEKPLKRTFSKWKRPIAKVYYDNFGFSVNGYQPMIDYLDFKDFGGRSENVKVHLPYLEERCITKYHARNPVKHYRNIDIDRFIDKGERIITQIRQNDAAGANSILNRTHTNWSMTKKSVQQVKHSCVADPRIKVPESDNNEIYTHFVPSNILSKMSSITSLGLDPIIASRVAHCRMERENSRLGRKNRNDEIDKHFDDAMNTMRTTVETIPQPSFTVKGPYGEVLKQDSLTNADDMVMRNRFRREEDMNLLRDHVDRLTRFDDSRSVIRSNEGLKNDELMSALSSLRKRQANTTIQGLGAQLDRIQAARTFQKPYSTAINDVDDDVFLDYLMKRQLSRPVTIEDYRVPLSTLRYKADTISDVQERVHNRANEIIGRTSEARKIRDRSKYLNILDRRPETTDFNLMVLPTRAETNIAYMSRGFSPSAAPVRLFDVDEEFIPPSPMTPDAYREYRTRNAPKPGEKIQSDYARVRDAVSRAKDRTSLLGLSY